MVVPLNLVESLVSNFNPESSFFTLEENRRRNYLVEKLLANYYELLEGNGELIDNIDSISSELDEIFYTALERYRREHS